MPGASPLDEHDLNRLAARLSGIELSLEDRQMIERLIAMGRDAVTAREAARTAGLVIGSASVEGRLTGAAEAFQRGFAPGGRATIGKLPPHR